jgi:hypothetical protein
MSTFIFSSAPFASAVGIKVATTGASDARSKRRRPIGMPASASLLRTGPRKNPSARRTLLLGGEL